MNYRVSILLLLLLILAAFFLNLTVGNANISIWEISQDETARKLILNYRLPKAIAALMAGAALSVTGFLLQELFRNPLADPSVLGITSASGLGVGVIIFLASVMGLTGWMNNSWLLILASFIGALPALLLLVFFSSRLNSTAALIIIGFMIAGFASAIIGVMQFFAPSEKIKSFLMWTFGSVSGLSWEQIFVFGLSVIIGLVVSLFTLKGISGMRLGEQYAMTMGVNVKRNRWLILISSALLTAAATAFVGPIAFIGLAVPHICRMVFSETGVHRLYVLVVLTGILLMLVFVWISQLFPGAGLPINIITSLLGAPIVISIIWNRSRHLWRE